MSSYDSNAWTISEAKAKLSEILRLSNETPQYIGTKKSYVLITQETWENMHKPKKPLGAWLVENASGLDEIELPSRVDPDREVPFQ